MSDFLQQMAKHSAERAAAAGEIRAADLDRPVVPLTLSAFDVIAEIKGRSPAEGKLASVDLDRAGQARRYADGGAAAISVLTEPSRFDGHLAHLEEVVAAVPQTPVMRKDFLVEPVQILEARRAGASGVLLIAAMLVIPTTSARLFSRSPEQMVAISALFGLGALAGGIGGSYYYDWQTGPAIVVSATALLLLTLAATRLLKST